MSIEELITDFDAALRRGDIPAQSIVLSVPTVVAFLVCLYLFYPMSGFQSLVLALELIGPVVYVYFYPGDSNASIPPMRRVGYVLTLGLGGACLSLFLFGIWASIVVVPVLCVVGPMAVFYLEPILRRNEMEAAWAATKAELPFTFPTAEQFKGDLLSTYERTAQDYGMQVLIPGFRDQLISVIGEIYQKEFFPSQISTRHVGRTNEAYKAFVQIFTDGLIGFSAKVPPIARQPIDYKPQQSLFSGAHQLQFTHLERSQHVWASHDIEEAYRALTDVFRGEQGNQFRRAHKIFDWRNFETCFPPNPTPDDDNDHEWDSWLAECDKIQAKLPPLARNAVSTPYWGRELEIIPKDIIVGIPVQLDDDTRFRHQWVLGDTGAGKTTFLSAMIAEDLKRVARDEISIFVMDSQNELIPEIANWKAFAPGKPLHGKLIYLEPDPDYPLALNIFDVNRERMGSLIRNPQRDPRPARRIHGPRLLPRHVQPPAQQA